MSILYYFILFMFAGPLIRNLNYYFPGLGSLLYFAFIVYIFYASSRRSQNVRRTQYQRNNTQYYTNTNQQKTNTTSSKVKSDVIDVEFSEHEVE